MAVPPTSSKPELRRAMRARRAAYVRAMREAERRALEAALAELVRPRLFAGAIVASYLATGAEIDADGIIDAPALPWFAGPGAEMVFRKGMAVEPGPYKIGQPAGSAPEVRPDIMLVPLVAADGLGGRLGQGGGHYDRALRRLRSRGAILAIGLAWEVQLVERVPQDAWDERLDAIATPGGWALA